MDTIANFYNNLFGIEITALGIITAATFVCLQILHANYSYEDMVRSLKRSSVLIYAILSILLILFTGLGSLLLALGTHNFIPAFNFGTQVIFETGYTVLCILVLFLVSAALGIFIVFESIRLLNPTFLIRDHLNRIDLDEVQKSLYGKYGVPEPFPRITMLMMLQDTEEKKRTGAEEGTQIREAEEKYKQEKLEYERLKTETEGAPDVFQGFTNLVSKAIAGTDISTVRSAISDYEVRIENLVKAADAKFPLNLFARNIADTLALFLEGCRRHKLYSLSPELVRPTREFALAILDGTHSEAVKEVLKIWKSQADIAIQTSDLPLFREIMQGYKKVADIAFEQHKKAPQKKEDVLDECFNHLGWLAERLLTKKGIEAKPVMYDEDYHDEFESLYNVLMSFEWKYNNDNPSAYPLIFFDAVHVLFDQLLEIYKGHSSGESRNGTIDFGDIKHWLFDCSYVYASFAHGALRVANPNGVALAVMRLCDTYQTAVEIYAHDVARDIIDLIVRTAIRIGTNPEKIKGGTLSDPMEYLEKSILQSSYHDKIRSAVEESYFKLSEGPQEAKFEYIKSLGKKLNTNFGMRFDPTTGQMYSKDDLGR